jgi:ribosome-associated protein
VEDDLRVKENIVIPGHELEITASRSGGAGGQHVNKTSTRITLRWNVYNTNALTLEQKERVLEKLQNKLTSDGDLIIHNSESRSQQNNKEYALARLADEIRKALYVPKKRMATRPKKSAVEKRLHSKSIRGAVKKMRNKKLFED